MKLTLTTLTIAIGLLLISNMAAMAAPTDKVGLSANINKDYINQDASVRLMVNCYKNDTKDNYIETGVSAHGPLPNHVTLAIPIFKIIELCPNLKAKDETYYLQLIVYLQKKEKVLCTYPWNFKFNKNGPYHIWGFDFPNIFSQEYCMETS